MEQLRVATCCNLTDSGSNRYPCPCSTATNTGNCTWYCEYRAAGSNNFDFDGQGGHGYMWLEHAWNTGDYSVAGTIPEVGAIMVFKCTWGQYGHVAWVKVSNPNRTDGYWYFTNSRLPYVKLEDSYGGNNPESGRLLGFDAIRFIKR